MVMVMGFQGFVMGTMVSEPGTRLEDGGDA